MRLFMIRHGHAVPKVVDPQRPLSSRGREEVGRIARSLAVAGVGGIELWHSGYLRAEQTAAVVAEV